MADFVNTIDLLGEEATAAAIIGKTITEFNDDVITEIGTYAFAKCSKLAKIDLPNVSKLCERAFFRSGVKDVNLPMVTTIEVSAFSQCASLTKIALPNVTSLDGCFDECGKLAIVDLSKLTGLTVSNTFMYCSELKTLVIRNETVCSLGTTSVLNKTPFASGGTGGTVYVPQALITEYQNATNWCTLYAGGTCNFVAIEGSEYE